MKKEKLSPQEVLHLRNVISCAYSYNNICDMTINTLANSFKVSGNTIADWLCEAISKRYIEDDAICENISKKHIREYETGLKIANSSLRDKYHMAFRNRCNAPYFNLDAIA